MNQYKFNGIIFVVIDVKISATIWQLTIPSLVWLIACRLNGTKPQPKPLIEYK